MKAVSLGELNTVDLNFIIVAILERRIVSCEEQNDLLKKSLKKALKRINELENSLRNMQERKESVKMSSNLKSSTS
ncbi:unnamed protein product [Onchocerca flexuosa]|uniref:Mobile element protein n=1 Tax=Onchocerca flexuosa TaxID=387005 RepID=A0A183HWC8_9BILA|nr:unnamed protein product [Onchocerca flexuosa]